MEHALLDQIAAGDCDSDDALRVYADQRILAGDSFGELIVVAAERAIRDTPELRRREETLRKEHTDRLLALLGNPSSLTLAWHRGFVDQIRFSHTSDAPFPHLAVLAEEPAFRLLRRIEWEALDNEGSHTMAPIFTDLARLASRFPRLAEIAVGESPKMGTLWDVGPILIGAIEPIVRAFPGLVTLELDGAGLDLGDLVLPKLRSFTARELMPEDTRRLVAATLPEIRSLALGFRSAATDNIGATFGPLLHRDFGPQLEGFAFSPPNAATLAWVIEELPRAPIARHLKRLGFPNTVVEEPMLEQLIADAARWRGLERLELPQRGISAVRIKQLSRTFGGTLALI